MSAARNEADFFVIKAYERVTQSPSPVNDAGTVLITSAQLIRSSIMILIGIISEYYSHSSRAPDSFSSHQNNSVINYNNHYNIKMNL
jgi:hypothetical protein